MEATVRKPSNPRSLGQLLVLLLLLEDSWGSCLKGPHTLRYDLTASSQEGSGRPQFLALGYFDHELFLSYDGDSRRAQPWGLGMKGHVGAETWARETEDLQQKEQQLRRMLVEIMAQKGQDRGFHTLQATLGCELQENSTGSFWHLGYNGQDFVSYDPQTLRWKVAEPLAQETKMLWERHGPRADLVKTFLHGVCPAQLQRYLALWRNHLEDTGPPKVSVTHRKFPVGRITLTCWAFNLYDRTATLTWLRDGEPVKQRTLGPGSILPRGDGTPQPWVSTWILPGEEPHFSCHVQHCNWTTTVHAGIGEKWNHPLCLDEGRVRGGLWVTFPPVSWRPAGHRDPEAGAAAPMAVALAASVLSPALMLLTCA